MAWITNNSASKDFGFKILKAHITSGSHNVPWVSSHFLHLLDSCLIWTNNREKWYGPRELNWWTTLIHSFRRWSSRVQETVKKRWSKGGILRIFWNQRFLFFVEKFACAIQNIHISKPIEVEEHLLQKYVEEAVLCLLQVWFVCRFERN